MDPVEGLGPKEDILGYGTPMQVCSIRLLQKRHRLTAGADGKGVDAQVPDFAAFTERLVTLAGSLDALDSLVWACCFSGELL